MVLRQRIYISQVSGMCKEEYREFELTSMQRESEHCFLYRFSLPDDYSLRANAGQHLILRSVSLYPALEVQIIITNRTRGSSNYTIDRQKLWVLCFKTIVECHQNVPLTVIQHVISFC